jgi:hypothetical protein
VRNPWDWQPNDASEGCPDPSSGEASQKKPFAADPDPRDNLRTMKLRQNQVWKLGSEFLRIVTLERLEVHYKAVANLTTGEGKHHRVSKKEFCRLIKGATLLTPAEELDIRTQ